MTRIPIPTFYPDGGQCVPDTCVHITLKDLDGYSILYTTDYSDPRPECVGGTTAQYRRPIKLRGFNGGECLIRAVCVSLDGTQRGFVVSRAFHVTYDIEKLEEEGEEEEEEEEEEEKTGSSCHNTSNESLPCLKNSGKSPVHSFVGKGALLGGAGELFSRPPPPASPPPQPPAAPPTKTAGRSPHEREERRTSICPDERKLLPPPPEGDVTSLDYLDKILGSHVDDPNAMQTEEVAGYVCDCCGRSWSQLDRMLKHKEFCRGPSRPSKSRSPVRRVHWEKGGGGGTCGTTTGSDAGTLASCPHSTTTGGNAGMVRAAHSVHSGASGSAVSRASTSFSRPNIKAPPRKPLAVARGLKACQWCGREMKAAALESHVKRCQEEPRNKKLLAAEAESRRRAVRSPGTSPTKIRRGSLGSSAIIPRAATTSPTAPRRFSESAGSLPYPRQSTGSFTSLHGYDHSEEISRPVNSSAALQDRRDAWKRARAAADEKRMAELLDLQMRARGA